MSDKKDETKKKFFRMTIHFMLLIVAMVMLVFEIGLFWLNIFNIISNFIIVFIYVKSLKIKLDIGVKDK